MSAYNLEGLNEDDIREELNRRQEAGISVAEPSIVDRYLGGFLSNVKAMGAGSWGSFANPMTAVQGLVSDSTPINEQMGAAESQYPEQSTAYRFSEGALPAFIGGSLAGGPAVGAAAALVGGLANVGAKAAFPDNPLAQFGVNVLPGMAGGISRIFKGRTPDVPTTSTDPDTGVLLSPGQRGGSAAQLLQEQRLRGDTRTIAIASQFDKAQEARIEEFSKSLQNVVTKLPPEKVRDLVASRYDAFNKNTINAFKRNTTRSFTDAKNVKGDIIPTDNVKQAVDDLMQQYSNKEVPGNVAIYENLKKIRQNLTSLSGQMIVGPSGQPLVGTKANNISVDRLQQNLAAWGDTAYSGRYNNGGVQAFDDIDPGVAKGVARRILGAFKDDMDAAVNSGEKGAELLKQARDGHVRGLALLEKVANQPVNKYVTSAGFQKAPEKILEDIIQFRPSERAELAAVMRQDFPKVYDTVRSKAMTDILDKYRSGDGFDLRALFKDQPFGGDNAWLFANKAEQDKVTSLMQALEQINRKTKATDLSAQEMMLVARGVEQSAGAVAGAVAKYGTQAVVSAFRALALGDTKNPEKLAYMFFNPNGRKIIQELAKPSPSLLGIPRSHIDAFVYGTAGAAGAARDVTPKPQENTDFEYETLLEEARRRGLR